MAGLGGQMIQSLLKALRILSLFTRETPELRLKDICGRLGMPASTTHRLLRTLEEENYITQSPGTGKYRLGAAAFILGTNVLDINKLVDVSLPYIARLSTEYNATTHMGIEQNGHVLCVEKIESPINIIKTPPRGHPHALHLTSVGKCLLAYAPQQKQQKLIEGCTFVQVTPASIMNRDDLVAEVARVHRQGYATDACESDENLYCFGVPVLQPDGFAAGAISVSLHSFGFPDFAQDIIRDLKQSSGEISSALYLNA